MNFITLLNCFLLKKINPNRLSKYLNTTLNVALLLLLNIFTIIKISCYFFTTVNKIFNRYGAILTIILFIVTIFINLLFRDKNRLYDYQNININEKKMKLINGYIIVTILLFLLSVLI